MGKQGPCCHCAISTTPLWRNGPPEKPVLCNACGSRWRTKGTLYNYMPMHSGGFGASNSDLQSENKWSRARKNSAKLADQRSHKRKEPCDGPAEREVGQSYTDSFAKVHDEDTTASRSCSGSGVSGSEGSVRRNSYPINNFEALQPPVHVNIPSRRRSVSLRHPTPADRLTGLISSLIPELVSIACPVPCLSGEALLVDNRSSLVEIGLGGVLVKKKPGSINQEFQINSPFLLETKGNESFNVIEQNGSGAAVPQFQGFSALHRDLVFRARLKEKLVTKQETGRLMNKALLENFPYSKKTVLESGSSPLGFLELKDIVNFDTFTGLLTLQEQIKLMQYLPSEDLAIVPDSLKSLFSSPLFETALGNFQQHLSDGMFQSSIPAVLQLFQQLLTVTDLEGSGWRRELAKIQNVGKPKITLSDIKATFLRKGKAKGMSLPGCVTSASGGVSTSSGFCHQRLLENAEGEVGTSSSVIPGDIDRMWRDSMVLKPQNGSSSSGAIDNEAGTESEGSCLLSERSNFSNPGGEPPIGEIQYMGVIDTGEADSLLFDVPNPMSLQDEDLLRPSWSKSKSMKEEENDPESVGLIMGNTWPMDSGEWGLFWNNSSCVGPGRVLPNGTILNPGKIPLQ